MLPAAAAVFGMIYYDYKSKVQELQTNTISTARALSSAVDQHIIGVQAVLFTLASLEPLQEGNLQVFNKQARSVKINGQAAVIVLRNPSKQQLVNTAAPLGSPLPLSAPPEIIEAMKLGKSTVTGLFTDNVLKKKVVSVMVPVILSSQVIYGLSAPLSLEELRGILLAQQLPASWNSSLVDANGVIVARTRDHEKFVGVKVRPALIERIRQVKEDAVESVTVDGVPVVTSFNRSLTTNWSVVIGVPRAEMVSQLQKSLLILLTGTALLLTASLLLAWYYGERIARTILALKNQALVLGRGEKIVPTRGDFLEASQLSLAFEQASVRLGEVNQALVQRNLDLQQFAFVASHDLRSPLRSVQGYLSLLEKRHGPALEAKGQNLLQRATHALAQMDHLTEDLLAYARLDSPAQPASTVDCNSVFAITLNMLDASITESGACIDVQRLPTVFGDRGQLVQLFQNLLGNALKYCNGAAPRIVVNAERGTAQWIFQVSDNGIGIELEHQQRIFEIFKRLHTAQEYPGNGIGLAICQRIVERHGGRIWLNSESGKGSNFFFSIPDQKVISA